MDNRPFIYAIIALALLSVIGLLLPKQRDEIRWVAYYDEALPPSAFANLDLIVFDREHHPDLTPLKGKSLLFAYVSIGEVHDSSDVKAQLKSSNLLININKRWNSHVVDIRAPIWKTIVLDQAKNAFNQGFDGFMLDTIDSPLHWAETQGAARKQAMEDAAVSLVYEIRKHYPQMRIILNRGFSILPRVSGQIDYILAESIYTKTNVSTGQFGLFPPKTYAQVAEQLQKVAADFPRLHVLTLDYWNTQDVNGLERIYRAQSAYGFHPYVTSPDLRTLTPIPAYNKN